MGVIFHCLANQKAGESEWPAQVKNLMVASDGTTQLENICTKCGICCTGTLFTHAVTEEPELESRGVFYAAGGELYEREGKLRFDLPCNAYCDGVCGIYENRLQICKAYKCVLLIRYESFDVDFSEAMTVIDQAKSLSENIADRVGAGAPSLYEILDNGVTEENIKSLKMNDPQLLLDVATLGVIRNKYFYGE